MKTGPESSRGKIWFGGFFVLLAVVLLVMFWRAFLPGHVLFANDGPLGWAMQAAHRMPEWFTGTWEDLNSIGTWGGSAIPNISYGLFFGLGPVGFAKFDAAIALLILGLAAWCFFRQLGLAPLACVLGGLAAALNSQFFSAACWGVAGHAITVGASFLALAALVDTSSRRRWLRVALGGLAVGMAVTEGADIGAIFSLYVAAFVIYQAWVAEGPRMKNFALGVSRVAVVAIFAAFLAAASITTLVGTSIQGVAGMKQDAQTKLEHWDWATQWSLPKRETLSLLVPGLFGYRMDTPDGGNYWGAIGRDPAWDRYFRSDKQGPPPNGFMRFSGGGQYAGVLVVLVAFWAALQALRKKDSVFSLANRRSMWFWMGVIVISLPLAFGRFAPFYRLLYALPYFSTIRNPGKFLHPLSWAMVILFAYGVHGLCRRYLEAPATSAAGLLESLQAWWQRVRGFDRRWTLGCLAALGASALGWLIYASSRNGLENYLQEVRFDAGLAQSIAKFSIGQAGWFVLFLAVAVGLVTLVLSGALSGPRAKWAGLLLGLFLVVDLGRANRPWIIVWDYEPKYASNPIVDFLRDKPYEHRVAGFQPWFLNPAFLQAFNVSQQTARAEQDFHELYSIEWAQHLFLYYNVQSLDKIQMPRPPEDLAAFESALQPNTAADMPRVTRQWQLTNTRYLLGATGWLELLNQQFDPGQHRFRVAQRFWITFKPGIARLTKLEELTAVPDTNGPFAVFEFTGALPRAKLYANWQVNTNNQATLAQLVSPAFDPEKSVLVAGGLPAAAAGATNQNAGTVEFTRYTPKDIVFKAQASAPAVLLLNDRFDPNWKVLVDGKREALLRCNYIMRGVYLGPGTHQVEFRFEPPTKALRVSLAAIGVAVLLSGLLLVLKEPAAPDKSAPPPPEPASHPRAASH